MSPPPPIRILIMDDDPGQARLAQRTLERAGYVVEVATDGESGLHRHAATPYDVLLVDHRMPGKGGLEVLQALGTAELRPPVIMVTGHGDEAVAVEAMKLGASDYAVKDVEGRYLTLLPTVVTRALHQQQLVMQKLHAEATLQETLATLEMRVQQRTAALQRLNTQLQAEMGERRQAEAALAQLHHQQQLILESVGEGIYGLDCTGKATFVNPAAAHMLGWPVDALVGQVIHDRIHPPHPDGTPSSWETSPLYATCQTGAVCHLHEDLLWRQDGSRVLVEYTGTPIREQGQVTGVVVVFRDITARQRAAQEMQRADRLALVGQLASSLAHEIGTPLNVIAGNAELLHMQLRDQGIEAAELHVIVAQAERITRLIERLLHFTRPREEPLAAVPLHEPLSQALSLMSNRLQRDAISTLVEVPQDLPCVRGTSDQLTQVFLNLLVNAWHAMPAGGILRIAATPIPPQQVCITFQDSGVGMDQATLARVFEPFYTTKGDKGTGLGLAICHQIIERSGGSIRIESTPGVGTLVTIALLQADAAAAEPR